MYCVNLDDGEFVWKRLTGAEETVVFESGCDVTVGAEETVVFERGCDVTEETVVFERSVSVCS